MSGAKGNENKWFSPPMVVAYVGFLLGAAGSYNTMATDLGSRVGALETWRTEQARPLHADHTARLGSRSAWMQCQMRFNDEVARRLGVPATDFPCVPQPSD